MSIALFFGAISALGTIAGTIAYLVHRFQPTADQKNQSIDQEITEEREKAETEGRPE